MTDFNAGTARAIYQLDISQFEAGVARVKARYAELAQIQAQAIARPPQLPAPTLPTIPAAATPRALTGGGGSGDPAAQQQRAERAILARANAEARLTQVQHTGEQATVGLARAESIYQQALARVDQTSISAIRTQTQLAAVQNRLQAQAGGGLPVLPRTLERFGAGAIGQVTSAVQSLGLALGAQQFVQFGVSATQNALALREIKNSLRAVSIDQTAYNSTLALARKQQVDFGGSLRENIEGLQGLAITARQSGADLKQLVDLTQRLNVLSPEQGIGGARVALAEALSGNISSLAKRFEIPRSQIEALSDESKSASDRLKVLDEFLNKVGVTSAAVSGKIDADARAFRELAAAGGDLKLALGEGLAATFAPVARDFLDILTASKQVRDELIQLRGEIGRGLPQPAQEAGDYAARLLDAGTATGRLQTTTFGLSSGLKIVSAAFRGNSDDARVAIGDIAEFGRTQAQSAALAQISTNEINLQSPAMIAAAQASIYQSSAMIAAGNAAAIQAQSLRDAATAAENHRNAVATAAAETLKDTTAKAADAAQTDLLQAKTRAAAEAFLLANPGISESGIRAQVAAGLIPALTGEIAILTGQIRAAKAELGGLSGGRPERGGDALNRFVEGQAKATAFIDIQAQRAKEARDAQTLAIGSDKEKLRVLQEQLATQQRQFGVGSAEAIQAETALKREQDSQKARAGRSGGASKGLDALTRDTLNLTNSTTERLAEVNRLLERGNLTAHQRNQLLIEQKDLTEKIAAEERKAREAAVDAELLKVRNAQSLIKETRERAGLERQLQSGRFSAAQQETARLRLREIDFEQQKRLIDIEDKQRAAAIAAPPPAQTAPAPGALPRPEPSATPIATGPAVPTGQPIPVFPVTPLVPPPAPIVNLSLTIAIDRQGNAQVVNPPPGLNLDVIIQQQRSAIAGG